MTDKDKRVQEMTKCGKLEFLKDAREYCMLHGISPSNKDVFKFAKALLDARVDQEKLTVEMMIRQFEEK